MVVSNASPLILFAKINKVDLILETFGKPIIIEEEVRKELIDSGLKEGYADALYLQELVNKKSIIVKKAKESKEITGIHLGETKTIYLALELKEKTVLMDEEDDRAAAKAFGLEPKGTLYVLYELYKKKKLPKQEAIKILNQLIQQGYRLSTKYYAQFLEKLGN